MKNLRFHENELLNRSQLKDIFGGDGETSMTLDGGSGPNYCSVLCNSGVYIKNAPNCSSSTQSQACRNQGGSSGSCGGGPGC